MKRALPFNMAWATLITATCGVFGGMSAPSAYAQNQRVVTVYAASSLAKAYTALGEKFMAAHSQVVIKFSFGSSTTLAQQITAGAPADIFVSADMASMGAVASQFPSARNYVVNQVVLALPKSSTITKFADLNGKVTWLQCSHSVPCGIAADSALKSENVVATSPVSLEASASAATAKLLSGAVDAAILFKTDVLANPAKLKYIPFTDPTAAISQYQIGISNAKATVKNSWTRAVFLYLTGLTAHRFLSASGFIA